MTDFTTMAQVTTQSGSRYLQQLCKHWSHNLVVDFSTNEGKVIFPKDARGANHPGDAIVTFVGQTETLDVTISASSAAQCEGLKGAVARHLDRFAFREAPLSFAWVDGSKA